MKYPENHELDQRIFSVSFAGLPVLDHDPLSDASDDNLLSFAPAKSVDFHFGKRHIIRILTSLRDLSDRLVLATLSSTFFHNIT